MSLNKKLLAGAVLAGLAFSANVSAIGLGDDPLAFASELEDGTELLTALDDVDFAIGYNFSNGEVRYGRYECSANMTMDNVTLNETGGNVALGAINGEGTNALFFSMTGNGVASETDTITVVSDNTLASDGNVTCAFSIYDQPSQAQAGGADGRIYTTGFDTVIVRESGFVFEHDPDGATSATADVEAPAGPYFEFVSGSLFESFGNMTFEAADDVLDADGLQITLEDIFHVATRIEVRGDFTGADPDGPIGSTSTFTVSEPLVGNTTIFFALAVQGEGTLDYFPTEDEAIAESEFTALLNATANAGYEVDDVGPIFVGEVVRNGTQLQAPLVQTPNAWVSRIVLTNTGTTARPYEMSIMGESGNIIGIDSTLLVGTVPANGTKVIELDDVLLSFSGQSRATINVTVAAPNGQIQGLYQIVNPDSGSISNHVMVRPGTN